MGLSEYASIELKKKKLEEVKYVIEKKIHSLLLREGSCFSIHFSNSFQHLNLPFEDHFGFIHFIS